MRSIIRSKGQQQDVQQAARQGGTPHPTSPHAGAAPSSALTSLPPCAIDLRDAEGFLSAMSESSASSSSRAEASTSGSEATAPAPAVIPSCPPPWLAVRAAAPAPDSCAFFLSTALALGELREEVVRSRVAACLLGSPPQPVPMWNEVAMCSWTCSRSARSAGTSDGRGRACLLRLPPLLGDADRRCDGAITPAVAALSLPAVVHQVQVGAGEEGARREVWICRCVICMWSLAQLGRSRRP